MLAASMHSSAGRDDSFWDRLDTLELRHQNLRAQHDSLRRSLDELSTATMEDELREIWKQYCEVVAELEHAADEFIVLRLQPA
jgi:hypothetical protein